MRTDPIHRNLTFEQIRMLSDIFRLIIPEVNTAEDRDKLAPGEVGISYKTGEFWIRNPHNGKLFTPNSVEHIKNIYKKFLPGTDIFNADRVHDIRIYLNLLELDKLQCDYTPDSVIRQMNSPGFLCAPVEYENYEGLGWPDKKGIVTVHKIDEENVLIRYQSSISGVIYDGRYNSAKHMFEGWMLTSGVPDDYYCETEGGGNTTNINISTLLEDLMIVIVKTTEDIFPGGSITVNGQDEKPLIKPDGLPIDQPILADTTIMLIYDKVRESWIVLDSTESVILAVMKLMYERFQDVNHGIDEYLIRLEKKFEKQLEELQKTMNEKMEEMLKEQHDKSMEIIKSIINTPGTLVPIVSYFTVEHDDTAGVDNIESFNGGVDKLIVNYGQTLLRIDLDYVIVGNGIRFTEGIRLVKDDILQFIVLKQVDISDYE